ncbi:MAG: HAD-IC family P-type ATPase, partial [Ktedonobacteraceae bacterium]
TILKAVSSLDFDNINEQQEKSSSLPPAIQEKQGRTIRVRVAMRGLDRDPHLAKRVVERLESQPGVHAGANPLTGRVLVEFEEQRADLNDLIALVADLELPELPGEDRPAYPLDPGPLIQSMTRTVGAALSLGFLATRRLIGSVEPLPGSNVAFNVASVIGIVYGIPPIRYGLRRLFGRTIADLLVNIPSIVTLTLAGSPLGLTVNGLDALRLLTEVQARRSAWRRHEERVSNAPSAQPDAVIRLENGERTPLAANVIEGTGTALGHDGMPLPAIPGNRISPGARLYGGPFLLQLQGEQSFQAFTPEPRPAPVALSLYDRYQQIAGLCSFVYAGLTAIFTRSFSRTLTSLLLVNTRAAIIGHDSANLSAVARVIRAGVTVVGTRANRTIRLPNLVLLDGARLLTDKLELASVLSLIEGQTSAEIQAHAASVSSAAGMPWGGVFRGTNMLPAANGNFDGRVAAATIEGARYALGPIEDWSEIPTAAQLRQRGNYVLVLRREREEQPLGLVALRPQLATGVQEFVQTCQRYRIELAVLAPGDQIAVRALAQRAHIARAEDDDAVRIIRLKQQDGGFVAFVSDNVGASAGFAACDLAIGITDDRSHLPAPADLLAPDLTAVAAIIEAAARWEATVRDSIGLSAASNIIGAIWGLVGELAGGLATETASRLVNMSLLDSRYKEANVKVAIKTASRVVSISSLAALADGWLRLRGGEQASSTRSMFVDPRPERWGSRSLKEVLRTLRTSEDGLTSEQAAQRRHRATPRMRGNQLLTVLLDQIRSPLIGLLAAGAGLSLIFGAVGDVAIIASTIAISVAMSAWQEQKANQVAEALQRVGVSYARVLRDNQAVLIPANEVVPGDILLLASGDRIAADARVISSQGLEVDEAALTGESLPVSKVPAGKSDINHIVLEGSDVTSGTGRAIVVAVGQQTRMGATRAALAENGTESSPLGVRLSRMLSLLIPLSIAGGVTVVVMGLFWGQPLTSLLALGVTVTLAAVPEGLPLLAKVGEAGVARRLADQQAVVRRLSSVEALGRVDVACADKTGTMTRGRLQLSLVAD